MDVELTDIDDDFGIIPIAIVDKINSANTLVTNIGVSGIRETEELVEAGKISRVGSDIQVTKKAVRVGELVTDTIDVAIAISQAFENPAPGDFSKAGVKGIMAG